MLRAQGFGSERGHGHVHDYEQMELLARQLRRLRTLVLRTSPEQQQADFYISRDELLGYRDGSWIPAAEPMVQDAFRAVGELARAVLGLRLALGYETEPADDVANSVRSREELETEAACLQAQDEELDRGAAPTGLDRLSTRLAFQVATGSALAVLGGELLSPQRWYWAVLTCWVVFLNTSSIGDILVKGYRRLAGTVVGVLAGAALAGVVGGDPTVAFTLVIVCVFGMFYTAPLSYTLMSFFVTTMIGVLYSLLGIFSTGLLVLRIEETAVGAACGFLAATVVLPIQVSKRTDILLADVLDQLRGALSLAVSQLAGRPQVDVFHATRGLDSALDTLRSSVEPITHPASPLRARRRRARYVLGILEGSAYHIRNLAAAAELSSGDPRFGPEPRLEAVGLRIGRNAQVLADFVRSEGRKVGRLENDPDITALFTDPEGTGVSADAPVRALPEGLRAWHVLPHLQRLDEALQGLARPLGLPSADDEGDGKAGASPEADQAVVIGRN